jgi:glycosyltransferase involved in cell wall biosynthesis
MEIERFYIDLSMLSPRMTGVGIYSIKLAQYIETQFDCTVISPPYFKQHFQTAIESPEPLSIRTIPIWRSPSLKNARRLAINSKTFIYCPHPNGYFFHNNQVISIHDLIAYYYPTRNFVENAYYKYLLPNLISRLRAVFTVSETSKAEICNFFSIDTQKVHVVPNGIDLATWSPGSAMETVSEPYLLVVSANRLYKNTIELLEHHSLWANRYRLKLVSTKARYGIAVRQAVSSLGLEATVDFIDNVPEEQLVDLYRKCAAVVYPSLMEGFGRPALEAIAVGRPIILSDIPVHKENFQEAAIFITPGNAETWVAAFDKLKNCDFVASRVQKGLELAKEYAWDVCGQKLVEVLLRVEPSIERLRKIPLDKENISPLSRTSARA